MRKLLDEFQASQMHLGDPQRPREYKYEQLACMGPQVEVFEVVEGLLDVSVPSIDEKVNLVGVDKYLSFKMVREGN